MIGTSEDQACFDAPSEDQPRVSVKAVEVPEPAAVGTWAEIGLGDDTPGDGPRHPALYRRLKNSFGPTYLTLLSIIQGVALSTLAAVVVDRSAHFTLVNWLLGLMTFCVLVVTWNVYTAQSIMWDWIPDLRDWAIPFVIGAIELFLANTLATSMTAWLLGLAVFAFVGALATQYISFRAKEEPENAELLRILISHHRMFSGFLAAAGGLLIVLGLISNATGASAVQWGHDGRGFLALCIAIVTSMCFGGALYLAQSYLDKAVAYAHRGRLPRRHRLHLRRQLRFGDRSRSAETR